MWALIALAGCDHQDGRNLPPARADQTASVLTTTIAPATTLSAASASVVDPASIVTVAPIEFSMTAPWADDEPIPAVNTCKGSPTHDRSPRLAWGNVPLGTIELAVEMTDEDGVANWVMSGINPASGVLEAGVLPPGAIRAKNDAGSVGYSGPCPSSGTHSFVLKLIALSQQLEANEGEPAKDMIAAIDELSLGESSVSGSVTVP